MEETTTLVQEGRHTVKPVEWGLTKTSSGKPNVFITFTNGLTWFGSLNEGKAREFTIRSLVNCGFRSDNLKALDMPNALDTNSDVSIVVAHEEYNGKTRARVQWVNKMGSLKASKEETAEMLNGLDLRGDFMVEMQDQGVEMKKHTSPIQPAQSFDVNDIPF